MNETDYKQKYMLHFLTSGRKYFILVLTKLLPSSFFRKSMYKSILLWADYGNIESDDMFMTPLDIFHQKLFAELFILAMNVVCSRCSSTY